MKRGIIRIYTGAILIVAQIIAIVWQESINNMYTGDIWVNTGLFIGFFGMGIIGCALLFFGRRAYKKELYSELILHSKTKKNHTVVRWMMFSGSMLIVASYIVASIYGGPIFDIFTILTICSALAFSIYLFFYVYKRPSCLFSATLIFLGSAYIYNIHISNLFKGIIYFVIGVIYIFIAIKIYKEKFSIGLIKVLGWVAFALELLKITVYITNNLKDFYILGINYFLIAFGGEILLFLLPLGIFIYISIFKINVLPEENITNNCDTIKFCRKCGKKLIDESKFCSQCGTATVTEDEEV